MIKRATSPFKKSHSRQTSVDESLSGANGQHTRTVSGGSFHNLTASHSRQASQGASSSHPPVSGANQTHHRTTSRSSNTSQGSNFLAEQYDRDRRTLIDCCFTKPDSKTNAPPNNYMTHVRIIEDAKYPSSRPAPDSRLENKKKRVLVVSSKPNNPNAIQIHKARENSDGTFQIGRTWDLKEFVRIESDTVIAEGFLVTMGKKYYWETNSAKEKTVFVKTLIKIYMQVFDGRVPELVNWDLSMFYLDERSYQRAVITRHGSSQPTSPTVEKPMAQVQMQREMNSSTPSGGSTGVSVQAMPRSQKRVQQNAPQQQSYQQNVQQQQSYQQNVPPQQSYQQNVAQQQSYQQNAPQNVPQRRSQQQTEGTPPPPKNAQRNSLNKAPYSSATTINRLSNQYHDDMGSSPYAESDDFQTPRHDVYSAQSPVKNAPDLEYQSTHSGSSRSPVPVAHSNSEAASGSTDLYPADEPQPRSANRPASRSPQRNAYQGRPRSTVDLYSPSNIHRNSQLGVNEPAAGEKSLKRANVTSLDDEYENMQPISFNNLGQDKGSSRESPQRSAIDLNDQSSEEESLDLNNENAREELDLNANPQAQTRLEHNKAPAVNEDDDLNTSIHDYPLNEAADLSFERGDEVRYSQVIEPGTPHVYHEVTTIQEESQTKLPEMVGTDIAMEKADEKQKKKKIVDVNDEALLETLTDVNWNPDDDTGKLLERIDLQLAEIEHKFNTNILALENVGADLKTFEEDVDKECDKMNPTFALYLMELNTFADDIDYVESRDNGLQIESANKKMLWNTLSDLLNTVSLDEETLKELLKCPIREKTLPWMETQLDSLSRAIKAIRGVSNEDAYSLQDMQALKKRRQYYEKVTELFLERVVAEMGTMFEYIRNNGTTKDQLVNILQRLLTFSSLIIFCKEISTTSYNAIMNKWNKNVHSVYNDMWIKIIKKLQDESMGGREVVHGIANQPGEDKLLEQWTTYKKTRKITTDMTLSSNTLTYIIDTLNLIEQQCIVYQNYVDNFFHISSTETYTEYVKKFKDPSSRIIDLSRVSVMDSDRDSALKKSQLVSKVFNPVVTQLISYFVEMMKFNQSTAPSVMLILEQKLRQIESTDQEFLIDTFTRILTQLKQLWAGFMEDELLYVERIATDTSSKAVLPTVVGLPIFIKNTQDALLFTQEKTNAKDFNNYEVPRMVNESFSSLCGSIVHLLAQQVDNNVVSGKQKTALSTDQLTQAITLLENTNWLIELLTLLNVPLKGIFEKPIQESKRIFDIEKDIYANFLLQDAIPKLTSFVNGATHVVEASPNQASSPAMWGAYSKSNLQNILTSYNSKEINVLATRLHKRLLKHFTSGQPDIMRDNLCDKLWSCLQGQTVSLYLRLYTLIDKYYKGTHVKFSKNDIISSFELFKETQV